jgi:hypothetical protein
MPGDEFLQSLDAYFSSSIVNRSTSQLSLGLNALEMKVWEWTKGGAIFSANSGSQEKSPTENELKK